jgi:hypothetical protein
MKFSSDLTGICFIWSDKNNLEIILTAQRADTYFHVDTLTESKGKY